MRLPEGVRMTPMLRQYCQWKEKYPDCLLFFRMGDFYEMFFDDAREAAEVLDITLTARDPDKKIPMAGVPFHAVDQYLGRLVQSGRSVAICEQITEPDGKTLVERSVVRVVTPGTYVPSEGEGDGRLAVLLPGGKSCFVALLSPSTGNLQVATLSLEDARGLMASFAPREILLPPGQSGWLRQNMTDLPPCHLIERPRDEFNQASSLRWLTARFEVASLRGFGIEDGEPVVTCAAAALRYLEETQFSAARHVTRLVPLLPERHLFLDVTTQRNLELVDGDGPTLFSCLNRCRTAMGRRMLRDWILNPLRDLETIGARQDAIEFMVSDHSLREHLRDSLGRCRDMERALGRLSLGVGTPRDLGAIRDTLLAYPAIVERCGANCLLAWAPDLPDATELGEFLKVALVDEPPRHVRDGGVVREGFDASLDRWRQLSETGNAGLEDFARGERERTGIRNLKVGYNRVFGYFIEVSKSNQEKVPEEYTRKQTLVSAERYITPELKTFEEDMLRASGEIHTLEDALYRTFVDRVVETGVSLKEMAASLAELDVLASLSEVAWDRRYCRPEVDRGGLMSIEGGRHPVVEEALGGDPFTPNGIELDTDGARIALLTGPNMAGKSTYLRMAALLTIMAQMGSFIPAEKARMGLVDRIFTRIGARDELARGRSTFMVEMVETAGILHNVTDRSLVVLDEIGRGTSTYDGMSIAWAVLEYLIQTSGKSPRVLFATHYHELTCLDRGHPELINLSMDVDESDKGIVFLHRVVSRAADRSYGIEVARLAGIPDIVVRRATELLQSFEENGLEGEVLPVPVSKDSARAQLDLFPVAVDGVLEEIASLDPDGVTPLEALEILYHLKDRCREVLDKR